MDMEMVESDHHSFLVPPADAQHLFMPLDEQLLVPSGPHGGGGAAGGGRGGERSERKRRFTEEQIRSLESMFHAHHAKLEPREKAELARELGLQPRQVAIWFQNKRARWRSKQLEQDYGALRSNYDALHARVESLKQEKLALTAQLQELSDRLKERDGKDSGWSSASSSSCNGGCAGEYEEEKRRVGCAPVDPPESCVLRCATPADVSVESECDDAHLGYGGFPDSFCPTPELWEPWPLVGWNAVA